MIVCSWLRPPPLSSRDRAPKVSSTLGCGARLVLGDLRSGSQRLGGGGRGGCLQQDVLVAERVVEADFGGGALHQLDASLDVHGDVRGEVAGGDAGDLPDHFGSDADLGVIRQIEHVGERGVYRVGGADVAADLGEGLEAEPATSQHERSRQSDRSDDPPASRPASPGPPAHAPPLTRALSDRLGPAEAPGGLGSPATNPLTPQARSTVGSSAGLCAGVS
jgi:hypothetical protein